MDFTTSIISPKRSFETRERIFNYYAGFSSDFVRSILSRACLSDNAVVCDPWNGAGTTTQVCNELGIKSIGIDINPVAVLLANAGAMKKPIEEDVIDNLLLRLMSKGERYFVKDDCLLNFFHDGTARFIRALEREIAAFYNIEVEVWSGKISPEHAFIVSCLFKTVKRYCESLKGSNPTWIKIPHRDCRVKILGRKTFLKILKDEIVATQKGIDFFAKKKPNILLGNSTSTGLRSSSVDLILSSPPYLTRIDYIVSTFIELSILNYPFEKIKKLRDSSIGTPTIMKESLNDLKLGSYCKRILREIRDHFTVASSGYYDKFFLQYVHGVMLSSAELYRVTASEGMGVFVVQDSFYKDIKVDLAKLFVEIFELQGWHFISLKSFDVKQNMVHINSRSTSYRGNNVICEHIVTFQKK